MKSRLFTDVKGFVKYIQKRSYLIECLILALLVFSIYYQVNSYNQIMSRVGKVEKKVDFRYFNTTRSLEDIHGVEINTKNGKLERWYFLQYEKSEKNHFRDKPGLLAINFVTTSCGIHPMFFVNKLQRYIFIMTYYTPNFNPTP